MAQRECIYAWTDNKPDVYYQQYINISVVDGECVITVRGSQEFDGHPGPTVHMTLPRGQVPDLTSLPFKVLFEIDRQREAKKQFEAEQIERAER